LGIGVEADAKHRPVALLRGLQLLKKGHESQL
jgi:hypothetical protein